MSFEGNPLLISQIRKPKSFYTKLQVRRARSYIFRSQNAAQSYIDNLHAPSRTYR
jgi:hypothetical protein